MTVSAQTFDYEGDTNDTAQVVTSITVAEQAAQMSQGTIAFVGTVRTTSAEDYRVSSTADITQNVAGQELSELSNIEDVDMSTAVGAQMSVDVIDGALAFIDGQRSTLGAAQNRLTSTISNLTNVSENASASRSRIRDTDFATETASLTKAQILQQAGTSILAQANQIPQAALSLLG
ncbi:flagellin [Pseudoalteromonas denitrificans]